MAVTLMTLVLGFFFWDCVCVCVCVCERERERERERELSYLKLHRVLHLYLTFKI